MSYANDDAIRSGVGEAPCGARGHAKRQPDAPLLHHRDVGYRDEFQLSTALVVHERLPILRNQAMFGFVDTNHVPVVEPKRIRLERPTVVDF